MEVTEAASVTASAAQPEEGTVCARKRKLAMNV
jgi:hypothetical protein